MDKNVRTHDAVLLHESIIQGNHRQKSLRSFHANHFNVDLSADVIALDLNLAHAIKGVWIRMSAHTLHVQ